MRILDALRDPELFLPAFSPLEPWSRWLVFLAAVFCLPMTDEQLQLFRHHTGRERPPGEPVREAWVVVGRRGGKSLIAAPRVCCGRHA